MRQKPGSGRGSHVSCWGWGEREGKKGDRTKYTLQEASASFKTASVAGISLHTCRCSSHFHNIICTCRCQISQREVQNNFWVIKEFKLDGGSDEPAANKLTAGLPPVSAQGYSRRRSESKSPVSALWTGNTRELASWLHVCMRDLDVM